MRHPVVRRTACMAAALAMVIGWMAIPDGRASARAAEAAGKKYALLVGVDRYGKGAMLPGLGDSPSRDVEGLAEVLIESGYAKDDVIVMTPKAGAADPDLLPIAEAIRNQLALTLKPLKPGDSVLVMLAGHGLMINVPLPGGAKPVSLTLFCPMDANLAKLDPARFIPIDEVFEALEACKASTKLLLVDACRNELKSAPPEGRAPGIEMMAPSPSVVVLYSCSEKEVSWQDPTLGGHGVFSYFVIEGLKGAADEESGDRNGEVTLDELTGYVRQNVFRFVRTRHATSQMPWLQGTLGLFVLRDRTSAPEILTSRASGMKLKRIPAGTFWMGSDKAADPDETPRHRVRITRPFYLGMTEVTVGQFRRVVESTGYRTEAERDGKGGWGWDEAAAKFRQDPKFTWRDPGFPQGDDHPVTSVSWNDAVAYCNALSAMEGPRPYYQVDGGKVTILGGDGYRLPTEAEWEYACRAGTTTRYQGGDDPETLADVGNVADATARAKYPAWTWSIAGRDGYVYTAPVGRFRANGFGLFDMRGNVWEWCGAGFKAYYYRESPVDDPPGSFEASDRVVRGGCWSLDPRLARSAYRGRYAPDDRHCLLGFRVSRVR